MKRKEKKGGRIFALVLICCFIFAIVFLLSYQKTETITEEKKDDDGDSLVCSRVGEREGDIFKTKDAILVEEEIRATFLSDKIVDVIFVYLGQYVDAEGATNADAALATDYNLYMMSSAGDLNFNFVHYETTAKGTVYAKAGQLNEKNKKIFSLDDLTNPMTEEKIVQAVERSGFNCKVNKKGDK